MGRSRKYKASAAARLRKRKTVVTDASNIQVSEGTQTVVGDHGEDASRATEGTSQKILHSWDNPQEDGRDKVNTATGSHGFTEGEEDGRNFTEGDERNFTEGDGRNFTEGDERGFTEGDERNLTEGDGRNFTKGDERNSTGGDERNFTEGDGRNFTEGDGSLPCTQDLPDGGALNGPVSSVSALSLSPSQRTSITGTERLSRNTAADKVLHEINGNESLSSRDSNLSEDRYVLSPLRVRGSRHKHRRQVTGLRELEQLIGCSLSHEDLIDTTQPNSVIMRQSHPRKVKKLPETKRPQQQWTRSAIHPGNRDVRITNNEEPTANMSPGRSDGHRHGDIPGEPREKSNNINDCCPGDSGCAAELMAIVPMAIVMPLITKKNTTSGLSAIDTTQVTMDTTQVVMDSTQVAMDAPRSRLRSVPMKRKIFQVKWESKQQRKGGNAGGVEVVPDVCKPHITQHRASRISEYNKLLDGNIPKSGKKRGQMLQAISTSVVSKLAPPGVPSLAPPGGPSLAPPGGPRLAPPAGEEPANAANSSKDPRTGELVWAKLGQQPWWPAIIITGKSFSSTNGTNSWLLWFGDHKVSKVQHRRIRPFASNFIDHTALVPKRMLFMRALAEVLKLSFCLSTFRDCMTHLACLECAVRLKDDYILSQIDRCETKDVLDELISWARRGFHIHGQPGNLELLLPPADPILPVWVMDRLKDLQRNNAEISDGVGPPEMETGEVGPPEMETGELYRIEKSNTSGRLSWVRDGKMLIEDVCLSCESGDVVLQHPYFRGGLCQACKEDMLDCMFVFGEDGLSLYCVICSNGGELFVCDVAECSRVYCTGCISLLVGPDSIAKIRDDPEWNCFLCQVEQPSGLLERKRDWRRNVIFMYQPITSQESLPADMPKRPIRVLALFDGIGTGKIVLDDLDLAIEVYYASEIDTDAIMVTQVRHGSAIQHVGDITALTSQQIAKLCPIDLVIGGSPCNEFSIANPDRKGLESGSGLLFFEFHRVLMDVMRYSKDRHVFWLFENVCLMPKEVKTTVSRFLGCEPAMWDAKHFSPQQRRRYFWGNIPGLYCPQQVMQVHPGRGLDDSLMGARKAKVTKIRAVTTRTNSLMQGKKDDSFPVQMGDVGDTLWIPELESIFGFPAHYTDVNNLPPTRRQKLIGKAWSIPVMRHILSPLKQFYVKH